MTRNFPRTVDVVVVGSGPCGAAYARILSERAPGATIALFEVGPQLSDPPGGHVKNIADAGERARAQRRSEGPAPLGDDAPASTMDGYADPVPRMVRPGTFLLPSGFRQPGEDGIPNASMSSNVGGMGAHWTCACPRPGGKERPELLADLDELLDEADRLLAVDAQALAGAPLAGEVRERLGTAYDDGRPADRRVAPMPLAVTRHADGTVTWSGSDVVFGEVTRANPSFSLHADALVTRVTTDGGRVTGVRVRDVVEGTEHEVAARFVVVAADTLRTPQLLWASGIRPAALGHHLNDQPQTVFAVRLHDVPPATDVEHDPRDGATAVVQQSGVNWVPYTDEEPFHGQVMQLDASPVPLAPGDVPAPGTIVGLGWFCAKDIRWEDRVEFDDDELDAYGMPAMRIHYRLTDADHASIAASREAVVRAGRALGEPLDPEPRTFAPGASLHYQGTVRMGATDDGLSVCSPDSEVWGVDRLYVAGNGVIPTPIACNSTLTSVALAVAGARDIARRLTSTEGN